MMTRPSHSCRWYRTQRALCQAATSADSLRQVRREYSSHVYATICVCNVMFSCTLRTSFEVTNIGYIYIRHISLGSTSVKAHDTVM